jgi:hypothetical protein
MVSPMVDSDMVVARCKTGTIQQALAMKTSVATRPMRMMASDGDGRLRKRAMALKNSRMKTTMVPTSARVICQISIPWNTTHFSFPGARVIARTGRYWPSMPEGVTRNNSWPSW